MIGISAKAQKEQATWEQRDLAAWNEAAEALKADGWTQHGAVHGIRTYFSKPGQPTHILVRQLGNLNWQPRPESNPYF
jgi:hypothetical protein